MRKPKVDQKALYLKYRIDMDAIRRFPTEEHPVIAWWSGGLTSAVTCKMCVDKFGASKVLIVSIDTMNEDEDTERFKSDCEKWYGKKILKISSDKYSSIQEVWRDYLSLNVATGAICSSELKREVRIKFGRHTKFSYQAFGFDNSELKRANGMSKNYYFISPIFPLIDNGITKQDCLNIIKNAGIEIPRTYQLGYLNNNCFKTGCVQGGIGYWQKMQLEFPDKFDAMANMEHELTDEKGEPVTMLKLRTGGIQRLMFLKPHKDYPHVPDISQSKGRPVKPLNDCNGFCNRA